MMMMVMIMIMMMMVYESGNLTFADGINRCNLKSLFGGVKQQFNCEFTDGVVNLPTESFALQKFLTCMGLIDGREGSSTFF